MNFGDILNKAQKNDNNKRDIKYYSTKFEPPKKEQRSKQLSQNIQRFLAKQKEDERKKQDEAQKKKDDLFALRAQDKKATRRVKVMLKRTKSANQSVIQDAVDNDNTAVTLCDGAQPDEDDYGYVSQESAAFYNKMMEKYSKIPDNPKYDFTRKKVSSNLNGTKNRVKAALIKEKEEASMPHRRKRKHESDGTPNNDKDVDREEWREKEKPKVKVKSRPAPPPMNFSDLLKIAEKKQFEPIVIEPKVKEEEKLFTKKQKKEMEREREWRERKELRQTPPNNRIPKLNDKSKQNQTPTTSNTKPIPSTSTNKKPNVNTTSTTTRGPILNKLLTSSNNSNKNLNSKTNPIPKPPNGKPILTKTKPKELPPPANRGRKMPPEMGGAKPRQFPPNDVRRQPQQFPPGDVRRKPPTVAKDKFKIGSRRQILNDDDSEYDSEMDDFIDDGPGGADDYSKYISEIFGYDKNRYRDVDEDVDNMESTFAQQMREEVISAKIGIKEDLEDIKMEEEAKRKKAALLKKRK